jgi:hypothetical protein
MTPLAYLKAAAAPCPLSPNPSRAPGPQPPRNPSRVPPSIFRSAAFPPTRRTPGAPPRGEEPSGAACRQSRVACCKLELTGVGAAVPFAASSHPPSPLPNHPFCCHRSVSHATCLSLVLTAGQNEPLSSNLHALAGAPLQRRRSRHGCRRGRLRAIEAVGSQSDGSDRV